MNRRGHLALGLALGLLAGLGIAPPSAQASGETEFPYALSTAGEAAWIGGDLALLGAGLYLDRLKGSGDPSSIDASKIPGFDRLYTTSHSAALGTTADVLVGVAALLPAAALPGMDRSQAFATGVMLAETLGFAYGADELLKSLVIRYRPYAYSDPPPSDIGSQDISSSFPSRHATLAFASAVFAGTVFDSTHPGSPYRALVWGGSLGLATGISALRIASGDHFLSDTIAGAALGAGIGFIVPYLHRTRTGSSGSGASAQALSLDASPSSLTLTLRY